MPGKTVLSRFASFWQAYVYTTENSYYFGEKPNQYHGGVPRLKDEIYEYLYGHRNGIRFQTDLEKIISHGFDPKYSFRKDKEKK